MPKKLRCDRCGLELSDRDDVGLALEGEDAWHASARSWGGEPRGVLPCENYLRCGGEIVVVPDWRLRVKWFLSRRP